jgi:tetratricopeptide (TPR) repeat protein
MGTGGEEQGTNAEGGAAALAELLATTWNFSEPRQSEARFLQLAEELARRGDRCGQLQALTQAARARGLERRFAEGHELLDEFAAELELQPAVVRVRSLLERGRLFNSAGAREQALPLFERAWELGRSAQLDALAVDAAHMIAIVHLATPERAIEWNETALALARASRERRARLWLGSLLNNQGWSYFEQKEYQRALALFQEAYEFRREQDPAQPGAGAAQRIAAWCVARALRALGRVEEALARQTELAREWEAAGSSSGYVFEELGECLLAQGQPELAAAQFAHAHALLSKDAQFVLDEAARLERIAALAQSRGPSTGA